MRRKSVTGMLITMLALMFSISSQAQSSSEDSKINKLLTANAKRFLKNKNVNSVSIGVYKDGQTYTAHLGELEKGKGNTPNDETLYEIGSVSKTVTGYLTAKVVKEGKISLEDDIRLYLPGEYPNLEYQGSPIRIKHLLTHTGNVPMFLPLAMNGLYETLAKDVPEKYRSLEESYSKEQFFEDLSKIEVLKEPGTSYSYSNAGSEIVGHILEKVYEKSIDELLTENFSQALNIKSLAIHLDAAEEDKLIQGYWLDNDTPAPNQANVLWATGSGMKMTMHDMMQYAKLQLDEDNPIVKESQRGLFDRRPGSKVAYFWNMRQDKHGSSYEHHGGTSGMQNWLFIFPKYDLALSIMSNHSSAKMPAQLGKTAKKILAELIKG